MPEDSFQTKDGHRITFGTTAQVMQENIPTPAETIYFILLVACIYLSISMLLLTTENAGVRSVLSIVLMICQFSLAGAIVWYIGKWIKALQKILIGDA